jgi:CheY-like chemotaxis protein
MTDCRKTILIVDDDENNVVLLALAFEKAGIDSPVSIVSDGAQAIGYLAGLGDYSDRQSYPFPSLILLDIKMPILNGFEVLAWWQKWGNVPDLRFIVFSGSPEPEDIEKARSLGAAAYRVKREGDPTLFKLACEIRDYWLAPQPREPESEMAQKEFFHSFS